MNAELKQWIDNASYEQLLSNWRFHPPGHEMFQGEIGAYYAQVMEQKRDQCDPVQASKNIGW